MHMQTPSSHLYTSPRLCFIFLSAPRTPPNPLACSPHSPRSPSFLYDELLGGFSVWQEALSLIQDEKKGERQREKKKMEKEGENLRPLGALLSTL